MKIDVVDIVAKAIYLSADNVSQFNWNALTESGREALRKQARAALAAVPHLELKSGQGRQVFLRVNQWTSQTKATAVLKILIEGELEDESEDE